MKLARSPNHPCILALFAWFCLTLNLTAQNNLPGVDPGPRPMGTSPFLDNLGNGQFETVCQIILGGGGPFKFEPVICDDFDQPPSLSKQFPAGGAGQLIAGANSETLGAFWGDALTVFSTTATVQAVVSTQGPATIGGLGPSFNALSCFGCHAQPAVGGASPGLIVLNGKTYQTTQFTTNPEIGAGEADGAGNQMPCFLGGPGNGTNCPNFVNGPVVEVRFPKGYAGNASTLPVDPVQPNGVADLFTIQGRNDEPPNCSIGQEPINAQLAAGNAIFRTPTPTFGLGLVENVSELSLTTSLAANASLKSALGINGSFNRSGNDGTITRFGWKAQNKSLMMFAGEASNVEMGVTNELFPNERTTGNGANCTPNPQPEDEVLGTNPILNQDNAENIASTISSVMQNNAVFMRLNAAPSQCDYTSTTDATGAPVCLALGNNALTGQCIFGVVGAQGGINSCGQGTPTGIGCVLCHQDTFTTSNSSQSGLSNVTFAPYSDFALHTLSQADGDGVTQGLAGPLQFRTAPLWGIGQRFFFMHDGRFNDLNLAIRAHCPLLTEAGNESCKVIQSYENLAPLQQNQLLEFLRSL